MTNTSFEQDQLLANLRAADTNWRNGKRTALGEAQIIADRKVQGLLSARDHLVRQAFEDGIPKRQIGAKGLGTTSTITLAESLERTSHPFVIAHILQGRNPGTETTQEVAA